MTPTLSRPGRRLNLVFTAALLAAALAGCGDDPAQQPRPTLAQPGDNDVALSVDIAPAADLANVPWVGIVVLTERQVAGGWVSMGLHAATPASDDSGRWVVNTKVVPGEYRIEARAFDLATTPPTGEGQDFAAAAFLDASVRGRAAAGPFAVSGEADGAHVVALPLDSLRHPAARAGLQLPLVLDIDAPATVTAGSSVSLIAWIAVLRSQLPGAPVMPGHWRADCDTDGSGFAGGTDIAAEAFLDIPGGTGEELAVHAEWTAEGAGPCVITFAADDGLRRHVNARQITVTP